MLARTLGPEGRVDCEIHIDWSEERVPARTLGPEGRVDCEIHIDWSEERVPARTLGPEGRVDCEIPHRLERGTRCGNYSLANTF